MRLICNEGRHCEPHGHIAMNYVAVSLAFNIAIAIAIAIAIFKAINS